MLTHYFISFDAVLLHLIRIAVIIFILSALAVSAATLFLSWKRHQSEFRKNVLRREYEEVIFSFLHHGDVSEACNVKKKLRNIEKWTFIEIINDLGKYFKYKDQEKIKQIAAVYDLESYMVKNIKWGHFVYRTRALKVLVNIGCTQKSYPTLLKLSESKNAVTRLYATQNLILYGSFDLEKDFVNYKYSLSLWEQMSYFYLFKYKLKEVPNFSTFLYSTNTSIVLFGLRMMRLFHQTLNISSQLQESLMYKDVQIQMELYRLLAVNHQEINSDKELLKRFNVYNLEDMLSNYSRLDYMTTDIMLDIFYRTDNMIIKKHILICIYDYVSGGKSDIQYFAAHYEEGDLNKMCRNLISEKHGK
ncbi:hypothetical protein [Segatella paludivivens]|uniref:hypothetical protein n=1 Tax=Segatella paludivivens TaxID=185294 RepID=UPI0003785AF7|nr:hypothetical protein [Segatella paludivivens]